MTHRKALGKSLLNDERMNKWVNNEWMDLVNPIQWNETTTQPTSAWKNQIIVYPSHLSCPFPVPRDLEIIHLMTQSASQKKVARLLSSCTQGKICKQGTQWGWLQCISSSLQGSQANQKTQTTVWPRLVGSWGSIWLKLQCRSPCLLLLISVPSNLVRVGHITLMPPD